MYVEYVSCEVSNVAKRDGEFSVSRLFLIDSDICSSTFILLGVFSKDKSKVYLKFLNPNEKAELEVTNFEEDIEAIEYCNIHGLWRNNND